MSNNIYVIDLDGTLYDNSHRQHLIPTDRTSTEQWVKFNKACADDVLRESVRDMVYALMTAGEDVRFFTGRGDQAFGETLDRLIKDFPGKLISLQMRHNLDHRPAAEVKYDHVRTLIYLYPARRIVVLEDDETCVTALRTLDGVTVLQIDSMCSSLGGTRDGNK